MYTIDVDTGGTMTDALVTADRDIHSVKVDTTPHDLTVSFLQCLREAGAGLGYPDLAAFLEDVRLIRWSTTITSNVLAERRGPKIGLLCAAGAESSLYGEGHSPAVGTIVAPEHVVGLEAGADDVAFLGAVRGLLEEGVRRICVSFPGAFHQPGPERSVKKTVEHQFPDHFLGAVPVLLGSDMVATPDDRTRAHYSLANAYTHTPLAASLFKAEDHLKYTEQWEGPLLVGHTNGGVARIGKTKAVDTIESGPVFGTFAGAAFARRYGLDAVLCLDVGGTTAKVSLVRGGQPVFRRGGDLFGIPVNVPLALLHSIAVGGGSIARAVGGDVTLGPQSMGASPGPACYGLGGAHATLTDAFLLLGCLDPDRFMGGRRFLNADLAREAIERELGVPLGVTAGEAAAKVADCAIDLVADVARATIAEGGMQPADVALFAYGGNGPLFAPGLAERLGIERVVVFLSLGPVLSAFGSAISDVVHVYEQHADAPLEPGAGSRLGEVVHALLERAWRDLEGEGFEPAAAAAELEAEIASGDRQRVVGTTLDGDIAAAVDSLVAAAGDSAQAADVLRLRVRYAVGAYDPEPESAGEPDPGAAQAGARTVVLPGGNVTAPVYEVGALRAGHVVAGPALLAGGSTTGLVPEGWTLTVDGFRNARLERGA